MPWKFGEEKILNVMRLHISCSSPMGVAEPIQWQMRNKMIYKNIGRESYHPVTALQTKYASAGLATEFTEDCTGQAVLIAFFFLCNCSACICLLL